MIRDLSIYIHIPFCVRKCLYCDFLSFPVSGREQGGESRARAEEAIGHYVELLTREIKQQSILYKNHRVCSVFVGGGTPSLLSAAQMGQIMAQVRASYEMSEEAEITLEMNPGAVTEEKLRQYITYGINRISIGLQSADNEELARIGRIHSYESFLDTYDTARRVGFANINIDLMSALPGQSIASWRNTLERVTALNPEHISAYSLMLEEGTPLYEKRASYTFPSEEEDRRMYLLTGEYLAKHGYHRYEISNYAREGYECRHNKVYWQRGDYVGFGLGAASMVEEYRWSNPDRPQAYEAYVGSGHILRHRLTVSEQMEEFMFLGLRMMRGVDADAFYRKFGQSMEAVYGVPLQKLAAQGLLALEDGRVRLTSRGIDVSNYVMAEFLF
ncbi:MAG: radical SAM family heme chaperone HemW [Clostridiales bacterium]|nr:radical SAM family heme chaperone HemW [Clostridiales bacterium]